jgi:signal transduction histidine kinase
VVSFLVEETAESLGAPDLALAEELAHRAAQAVDNARLYGEVQELDRRKDVFLAMLGHELRNPLAAMVSSLAVLKLRGAWDGPNARALNALSRQTQHQVRLVEDLLDVSRITQGRVLLRTERVDLTRLVVQAVESARPLVESCRHHLDLRLPEGPIWLEGDATRLEQVTVNLINNAAKYTNPGGRISVSVETEADHWAVLRVRDNGIGMSRELLRRVFEVFTQAADARARAKGGLGLGLSLVRGLVQQHGGRVEAYSEGEGLGSELVVHLPLSTSSPGDPSARDGAALPEGEEALPSVFAATPPTSFERGDAAQPPR